MGSAETVLYLGDMITVKANDSVSGTISIAPNAKNPRDLDIVVDYKVDGEHPTGERREYRMSVLLPSLLLFSFSSLTRVILGCE